MPDHAATQRHLPALDGLRALAVMAVLAYHLSLGWAGGGYLGVDLFFVLSGFLITGLLLEEHARSGSVRLRSFWARRARRLLPAVVVLVGAVALYAAAGGPGINRPTLRGDSVATLLYFANWHFIAEHSQYFAQFTATSPLLHTWSLAIEEQFYLVWPIVLIAVLRIGGRRWRLAAVGTCATLAVASATDMAVLAAGHASTTRLYFGTDTRAFELMIGALVAVAVQRRPAFGPRASRALHVGGIAALSVLVAGWVTLAGSPRWMFEGGFVAAAVLASVVILSVARSNHGPLGRALSQRPVVWVGALSYGIYLWHWPVFVALTTSSTGMAGWAVDGARVVLTVVLATVSYYLVEMPIRRHGLAGWRGALAPVAAIATALAVVVATVPPTAAGAAAPPTDAGSTGTPHVFAIARTSGEPLRVLLMGDSVMDQAASGFAAGFAASGPVTVDSMAYPGWGLSKDPGWRTEIPAEVARYRPDVVIGTWSWDWLVAKIDPVAYRRTLDQAIALILTPGDGVKGVVLLSFPRVGQRVYESLAQVAQIEHQRVAWNTLAEAEARAHPDTVAYLPVADAVSLRGQFAAWLPTTGGGWVRVRNTDATHLCPAGTARYVGAVLSDVRRAWNLSAPVGDWWDGAWTHDPKYVMSTGYCPDDRPPVSLQRAQASASAPRSG